MAVLNLFCGPPGSGKTTLARRLEADGHGLRISTDDWQDDLGLDMADAAVHERLQQRLYRHALALLEHDVDVILEDGLWMQEERTMVFADARARGARIHWHVFEVPEPELWRRLEQRSARGEQGAASVSRRDLARILTLFEPPTAEERASVDECTVHQADTAHVVE
ncbi:AAA family ATPase [Brachybacterium sp. GCM10030267]|uniref:AAA family ATPase n=1 Tax=Brachybacterium sp. GCM10030267 TaxID=3273381 RepID=UPI00361C86A3